MRNSKPILHLEEYMQLKNYSKNTINNYLLYIKKVLEKSNNDIYHLTINDFNNYIINFCNSNSTANLVVSSGKLYFKHGIKRKPNGKYFVRPKENKNIIEILTIDEVWQLINCIKNIKQKTIISGIYLHGLRISEIFNIKYENIDRERGLLIIKQSKGKKDRLVPLHENWIKYLSEYAKLNNHKKGYNKPIFYPYSESSIRTVIKTKAKKCGINKRVYPHLLRDCYASHLLVQGIDTRFIQEILGHEKLETTQKYLHISAINISNVKLKIVA